MAKPRNKGAYRKWSPGDLKKALVYNTTMKNQHCLLTIHNLHLKMSSFPVFLFSFYLSIYFFNCNFMKPCSSGKTACTKVEKFSACLSENMMEVKYVASNLLPNQHSLQFGNVDFGNALLPYKIINT
jgi:hypothetical protein